MTPSPAGVPSYDSPSAAIFIAPDYGPDGFVIKGNDGQERVSSTADDGAGNDRVLATGPKVGSCEVESDFVPLPRSCKWELSEYDA